VDAAGNAAGDNPLAAQTDPWGTIN
jgi:hypothetical protein